jgi:hypothetical protein
VLSGGSDFIVVTDHCPNTFFDTRVNLSRRQARWSEFLFRFKFDWEYRPGRTNVADPLSRDPLRSVLLCFIRGKKVAGGKGLQTWTRRGANQSVTSIKDTNSVDSGIDMLKIFREGYVADAWFQSKDNLVGLEYSNEDGLWYLDNRVVVPAGEARLRVLEESHDSPYGCHFGKHKVVHQINRDFGGLVGGRMLKTMCLTARFVNVTKLRRLRKQGYCNRFLYRASSGKV